MKCVISCELHGEGISGGCGGCVLWVLRVGVCEGGGVDGG